MASTKILNAKKNQVSEKVSSVKESTFFGIFSNSSITAQDENIFRREISELGGNFSVIKNTLMWRVIDELNLNDEEKSEFKASVKGPIAHVLVDEENPFPVIQKFADRLKADDSFNFKFGLLEGGLVDSGSFTKLTKINNIEDLYAQLVGCLDSPVSGLVWTLDGIVSSLVWTLDEIAKNKSNEVV
ncbi:50S ribosomal protein L10 [bacterium]|nr:50S ribosomal protein L10 [bacterium]